MYQVLQSYVASSLIPPAAMLMSDIIGWGLGWNGAITSGQGTLHLWGSRGYILTETGHLMRLLFFWTSFLKGAVRNSSS